MEDQGRRGPGCKKILLWVGLILAVCLWFWGIRPKDYYTREGVSVGYLEDYLTTADKSVFEGQKIAEGFEMNSLYQGEYALTIGYASTSDQNYYEIVDQLNDRILAQGSYRAGGEYIQEVIRLEQRTHSVVVRSYLTEGELFLGTCEARSLTPVYTDSYWSLLVLLLVGGGSWYCLRLYRRGRKYELGLFMAALLICLPLMGDQLQGGHDISFHLSRIDGLAKGLLTGQFPVRLNMDFLYGAGYITPIMYPELFLYLPGVLCAAGASVLFGYKVLCLFINFATAFVGYKSMRSFLGEKTGFVFALFYLLNPYRMGNLYVRAAVGEALAMIFMPLALAGLWQLLQGDWKRGFWQAVVGITGIYQSHVISTLLLLFFGGLYTVGYLLLHGRDFLREKKRVGVFAGAAGATFALNLWTILPFVRYLRWDLGTAHDKPNLNDTSILPYEAFLSPGSSVWNNDNVRSAVKSYHSIGLLLLLGAAVFLFYWLCTSKLPKELAKKGGVCLLLGALALFMSTDLFPWGQLQKIGAVNTLAGTLQFAWRNLSAAALFWSVVGAMAVELLLLDKRKTLAAGMGFLCLLTTADLCTGYLSGAGAAMGSKSENWDHTYLDAGHYIRWEDSAQAVSDRSRQGVVYASGGALVTQHNKNGANVEFSFENPDPSQELLFEVPLYAYDLHEAFLEDGQKLELTTGYNHMICVKVPAGLADGHVTVRYHEPFVFRLAEGVSLLTLAGLALLRLTRGRTRKKQPALV